MYFIYFLIRPGTNIPFYIGKGSNNRPYRHFTETVSKNPYKTRTINKYLSEGFTPDDMIRLHTTELSEEEAFDLEKSLIMAYGRKGIDQYGILTNIHAGGSGSPILEGQTYDSTYGIEKSAAIRSKISKANSGKPSPTKGKTFIRTLEQITNYKNGASIRNSNNKLHKEMINRCLENARNRKNKQVSQQEKDKKKETFILNRKDFYLSIIDLENKGITTISEIVRILNVGRGKVETFFRDRDLIMSIINNHID